MTKLVKKVHHIARHRNGICGEPFYAVRFAGGGDVEGTEFVAILFDDHRSCAVLDVEKAKDTVKFFENSWRGDNFEDELREAIKKLKESEKEG